MPETVEEIMSKRSEHVSSLSTELESWNYSPLEKGEAGKQPLLEVLRFHFFLDPDPESESLKV